MIEVAVHKVLYILILVHENSTFIFLHVCDSSAIWNSNSVFCESNKSTVDFVLWKPSLFLPANSMYAQLNWVHACPHYCTQTFASVLNARENLALFLCALNNLVIYSGCAHQDTHTHTHVHASRETNWLWHARRILWMSSCVLTHLDTYFFRSSSNETRLIYKTDCTLIHSSPKNS